jgi:hypothetical protein
MSIVKSIGLADPKMLIRIVSTYIKLGDFIGFKFEFELQAR